MTAHLGYEKHERAAEPGAGNARNGTRSKAVLTKAGPVQIDVPRDRGEATQAANIAAKARREAARLRELPLKQAAARIEAQREAAEQARLAREARTRKLNGIDHGRTSPRRTGPSL